MKKSTVSVICVLLVSILTVSHNGVRASKKFSYLKEGLNDYKELKKLFKTKNNLMIMYINDAKHSGTVSMLKTYKQVADYVKGEATLAVMNCVEDTKKLCKKMKVETDLPYVIKHYKDGEFNRNYERKETMSAFVNFLKDPKGDIPWEEDETAKAVVHLPTPQSLNKLLRKETRPLLIMFYAPWCGFCKQLKPEFLIAAQELQGEAVLAAMDLNRYENEDVQGRFNITGFPTTLYFENGQVLYTYENGNTKDKIIEFIRNPTAIVEEVKKKEQDWSDTESEVVHLTDDNFDLVIQEESSVLVMFYAPWCGHCKKLKPEYEDAAATMKQQRIAGILAAVDVTREKDLGKRFDIKGFPTMKYFRSGQFAFDAGHVRDSVKLVQFMRDPQEPPPPPPPEPAWSEEPSEIYHLTADNFQSVLRKKKHALVMFYAPWCGYCKKSKPEYIKAADTLKDNPKVALAALDCTEHGPLCKEYEIRGYPTFLYFHYFNKQTPSPYHNDYTSKAFVEFLESKEPKKKDEL
uniref:Protein disulfide-isomerase A5 n=1 Tax=Cacopsylla melanoneura TaxID=428564 RepID=A0A8D8TVC3_9HEMI